MTLSKREPAFWHCQMHSAKLNGLVQRWADTAFTAEEQSRPVLLFLHGWPESWYSWRHQLKAVHEGGYRGIAPYMRGYGDPNGGPKELAEYNAYRLASDMLAVLQHNGVSKCALVGHDHGANTGWHLALLHPDVFVTYTAMSVPLFPRMPGQIPPVAQMRQTYGDERKYENGKDDTNPIFFYQLHHQLPDAAQDYAKNTRAALMALGFGDHKDAGPPLIDSKKLFVGDSHPAMWERLPQPKKLHKWISQEELEYYVDDYEKHGWSGGLNWYRVPDINHHATPQFVGAIAQQPCQFITGTHDVVIAMIGRDEKGEMSIERGLERLPLLLQHGTKLPVETTLIEKAGHWIQQEEPEKVNRHLLDFVGKHRVLFADGSAVTRSRL